MGQLRQQTFSLLQIHWKHRYCHGGTLRRSSKGRGARPLSSRDPIHLVFKINKGSVKGGLRGARSFVVLNSILKKYSLKFYVKVEQFSIQHDHIHLLVRGGKRSNLQSFFKVLAGQFVQRLTDTFDKRHERQKIWKYRPFTRVIKGYRPYLTVRNYIQLNECEVLGRTYSKTRLRGLSKEQLRELWE